MSTELDALRDVHDRVIASETHMAGELDRLSRAGDRRRYDAMRQTFLMASEDNLAELLAAVGAYLDAA